MVAVGLGWLFMRRSDSVTYRYGVPEYSGVTGAARARVDDARAQAQDRVADLSGRAQATASDLQAQAQEQMHRARSGFDQMLDESPLALGAVALAAGAAIGLAAPITPREHELMGAARDSMLDQVQSKAEDMAGRAQQVASKAASSVKQEVKNQGLG